jgi:hypothetical protein
MPFDPFADAGFPEKRRSGQRRSEPRYADSPAMTSLADFEHRIRPNVEVVFDGFDDATAVQTRVAAVVADLPGERRKEVLNWSNDQQPSAPPANIDPAPAPARSQHA